MFIRLSSTVQYTDGGFNYSCREIKKIQAGQTTSSSLKKGVSEHPDDDPAFRSRPAATKASATVSSVDSGQRRRGPHLSDARLDHDRDLLPREEHVVPERGGYAVVLGALPRDGARRRRRLQPRDASTRPLTDSHHTQALKPVCVIYPSYIRHISVIYPSYISLRPLSKLIPHNISDCMIQNCHVCISQ